MKLALRTVLSSFGRTALTALAFFFIITGVSYAYASWTEPSGTPPSGNVPPPLNTGSTAQTKTGDLTVNNLTSTGNVTTSSFTISSSTTAGYVLTADANGNATWQAPTGTSTPGYSPGSMTFTTPGNNSFTVPAGISTINVEMWGGGGGAGSNTNYIDGITGAYNYYTGGGGGGSGGYYKVLGISVTPGQVISFTVGAGGAGGPPQASWGSAQYSYGTTPVVPAQTSGASGGNSTFGQYTATGGSGGQNYDSPLLWLICGTGYGGSFAYLAPGGTGTTNGNSGSDCGPANPSTSPTNGTAGGAAVTGLSGSYGAGGGGTVGNNPGTPGSPGAVVIWW